MLWQTQTPKMYRQINRMKKRRSEEQEREDFILVVAETVFRRQ